MATTFHNSGFSERQYTTNYFVSKKLDEEHYLVNTDHGAWVVLSRQEHDLLRLERVEEDPNLFSLLESKGILLTEDNVRDVVKSYAERYHFLFRPPTLHIVTPTMRCNSSCVYCHSMVRDDKAQGFDMDQETAKSVVDFIFKTPSDILVIEFQGGDCLLNFPIVEYIMDYASEKSRKTGKSLKFRLVTNLTLMTDEILKSLSKRKIMGVATSLDGPREVHDKNRKYLSGKGTYDDVVYWIRRMKTEWKHDFNLRALTTITRHSLGHGREVVDEYIRLGFDGIFLRTLNNIGFAKQTWSKIGYSPEEYLRFWEETLDYIIEANSRAPFFEQLTCIFLKKLLQRWDPMFVDIQSPCGAAIGQLLYNYNGDIHTCDEGKLFKELRLGNVKTTPYSRVFNNKTLTNMIDVSSRQGYLCDNCVWNPYCGICPIYTHSAQGTIVSKLAMDDRCRINRHVLESILRRLLFSERDRKVLLGWYRNEDVFK
jgi:uncharacterized protein